MSAAVIGFIALGLCVLAFGFLLGAIWAGIRRNDVDMFTPFDDSRVEIVRRRDIGMGDLERFEVEGGQFVGIGPTMETAYANWLRIRYAKS